MKRSTEIWQKFVALPGARVSDVVGIASEQAIGGVIAVIRQFKPRRVLELGAGIGTLTYTVLDAMAEEQRAFPKDGAFFSIENNEFCLSQLSINLKGFEGSYSLLPSTDKLPHHILFDFVIVDGGGDLDGDMGTMFFGGLLAPKGVILVEGSRKFQRDCIEKWYSERKYLSLNMPAINPNLVDPQTGIRAKNKGYHLFIFEPSPWNWTLWTLRSVVAKTLRRLKNIV